MTTPRPHPQHDEHTSVQGAPAMSAGTSWAEQSAHAEKIRTEAANAAAAAEAERQRQAALDAPELAKAQRKAEAERRKAQEEAEAAEKARREREAAEKAEAERQAEIARRDERAAKAVKWFSVACFAFALPLQLLAFWNPARPWMLIGPVVLESGAWVMMRQAEAAIAARRMVWHYLVGAAIAASVAAVVNVAHGAAEPWIGLDFGLVGAFCSLAGPGVWAVHEFGARAKSGKATRAERKKAEAERKKAEAEVEAKRVEGEQRRKADAEKREAARIAEQAQHAARVAEENQQNEQRRSHFPGAWERYQQILAAHPLGAISRDKAWTDARRAEAHPEVWDRYVMLSTAAPADLKPGDLWAVAWRSVHGLPVGQTRATLRAELEARAAVEEVLAEYERTPERLAVDELLDALFPAGGDDGETGGGKVRRGGGGGPSDPPTTLGRKGKQGTGRTSGKTPKKPLAESDLDKVRRLADALGDASKLSVGNVRTAVGGGATEYLMRLRDEVKEERRSR